MSELHRINYQIHVTEEERVQPDGGSQSINYGAQSVVYANAADGARNVGASLIASNFRVRHKALKRRAQFSRFFDANSPFEATSSALQYVSNLTEALLTGYGERPNRVIFAAVQLISIFAVYYQMVSSAARTETISSALALSAETMVAFIIGLPDLTDASAQMELVMGLQASLGFFLLGVVFVSIIGDRLT